MHRLIIIIIIFSSNVVVGQNSCDNKSLYELEKQFNKADKRGKTDDYKYASMAFDIAECYRLRNDTSSLKWYRNNLRTTKSAMTFCDRRPEARNSSYRMGVSSFYLAKYNDAEKYLQIAIASSSDDESYYYLGRTLIQLGMWQEARIELLNFRTKSSAHNDVEASIKTCEENISDK